VPVDALHGSFDVGNVFVRSVEVLAQIADPFAEPLDVLEQQSDFLLNLVRLFAHLGVAHQGLDGADRQHQNMR
jgi:hypothetical protein